MPPKRARPLPRKRGKPQKRSPNTAKRTRPERIASPRPLAEWLDAAHLSGARCPVVGLGASAGGLETLDAFFAALPPDSGAAFVIVTHQQPGHTSLLAELLARHAQIPITSAEDGTRVERNHAYVPPPGCCVSIEDGAFCVAPIEADHVRQPIDYFFRSLARNQGELGVAIVLSGNGSDGTQGLQEVKAANGMVMAQDPATARYTSMPLSAIATQLVDFVLPPEQLASELLRYLRGRPGAGPSPHLDEHDLNGSLRRIMTVLRRRTGNDFNAYKRSTILRRVERRMAVHGLQLAHDYADLLDQTPYEVDALFKEILISVTSFFRDPEAFAAFERALIPQLARQPEDGAIRGWVAGCATGEEAYSLAISLKEALNASGKIMRVQIFATDLDQRAIDVARIGRYPLSIAADVPPERLARFFTKDETCYRVNKEIREMIVFATQNVIKDPPFTKLDFVSCRNLLIYLETELQKRVLGMFAYALNPGGLMLLGTSESLGTADATFATIDKKWKVFHKREKPGAASPMPNFPADLSPVIIPRHAPLARTLTPRSTTGVLPVVERALLTQFTPPSAIISERGELIYLHGHTGPFLEPAQGEPSHNLFNMAREGLRSELPAAIRRAASHAGPVIRRNLQVKSNSGFHLVTLTAQRLLEPEALRGAFLVSFELEPKTSREKQATKASTRGRTAKQLDRLAQLDDELTHMRENLQGTIEELETSNEELKSMNEEMQSTNEELQSANEELETSREEMQSLNEELQTVNAELEERNRALSQANDDMQNLLNSTEIATLFLDDKLAIKRFTTQAKDVFSLIEGDIGRPISDLAANLLYGGLVEDAREVLRTLAFREREIQTRSGAWRSMRIMPYRTHDNLIDGLVITFVDIDRVKKAEALAIQARAYAEGVVDTLQEPLLVLDAALKIVSANRAFHELLQLDTKLSVGTALASVGGGVLQAPDLLIALQEVVQTGKPLNQFDLEPVLHRERFRGLTLAARALDTPSDYARLLIVSIARVR